MGCFLLYDRHGIFVQFSCRKITWSGVICITELDQPYLPPLLPLPCHPPSRQTQTHWLCVLHLLLLHHPSPAHTKQLITKLTFTTDPGLLSPLWAKTHWNLPEKQAQRRKYSMGASGCVCRTHFACVCLCVCVQAICSKKHLRSFHVSLAAAGPCRFVSSL